jgi:hypothetical protein
MRRRRSASRGCNCRFIERVRLALLDPNRAARAVPEAGPQAVTQPIRDQPGLSINDFDRTFLARWNAQTAAVAQILVNLHYLA